MVARKHTKVNRCKNFTLFTMYGTFKVALYLYYYTRGNPLLASHDNLSPNRPATSTSSPITLALLNTMYWKGFPKDSWKGTKLKPWELYYLKHVIFERKINFYKSMCFFEGVRIRNSTTSKPCLTECLWLKWKLPKRDFHGKVKRGLQ